MVQIQCKKVDLNSTAKSGDSCSWLKYTRYRITVRIVGFQRIAQVLSVLTYGTTNTDDIRQKISWLNICKAFTLPEINTS